MDYKAWPFAEARQIIKQRRPPADRPVLFETGFGPSGLPHIGTFAEVARTTWVRRAFEELSGQETRLQAFSDDMDGLRKVPLNLPQPEMLAGHLGKPLHAIPDPFGEADSFSGYMNAKLRLFLDAYRFDYQFKSARQAYSAGEFDQGLSVLLGKVEEVRGLILPTLREENRRDWSPFMPICPECGSVYATRVTDYHPERDSLSFVCDGQVGEVAGCGAGGELSVLGGNAKVGWKVDWALRWFTYEVDYEMYGKDLIESAKLSARIVRLMGKQPPVGLTYELFLDEEGRKISKSVGRGLTVDTWVQYAPLESLLYYIYQNPKRARRLYWDVVPKCVDDYLAALGRFHESPEEKRPDQDVWHLFGGSGAPTYDARVNFSVVNNLISALGADSRQLLLDYLGRYDERVEANEAVVEALVEKGLNYYRDFVLPNKKFRDPTDGERAMLLEIRAGLEAADADADEAALQSIPFDVARRHGAEPRALFTAIYEVLLGQERGPRFGSFVRLVGRARVLELFAEKLG